MLKVLSVLALCGAVIGQTRNTNPCLGQTDATQFANDWTSCDSYFWCNLEVAYPAPPCADTFGFDDVTQTCTLDIMPCDACPATGSLAVGIAGDTTCTQYTTCSEGTLSIEAPVVCRAGLRFNRVTGSCDLEANVICQGGGSGSTTGCTEAGVLITGDRPSGTGCTHFIQCLAGAQTGPFECPAGTLFSAEFFTCDVAASVTCAAAAKVDDEITQQMLIPSAPQQETVFVKKSFRERLAASLHLNH